MNDERIKQNELVIQERVNALNIIKQEDYLSATNFIKEIKSSEKIVKETFKDMKEQARLAYKTICDRENAYLAPLKDAETKVKSMMSDYLIQQEKIQKAQIEESKSALDDIINSNAYDEDINEILALAKDTMATTQTKVSGVSSTKDYDVLITDETQVPSYVNGIEIRPISKTAISKLAKMLKGNIQINGVELKEKKIIRVRS